MRVGSGKTLVYALPILQALLRRVQPRLRALVLLPTNDLALQVWLTFGHSHSTFIVNLTSRPAGPRPAQLTIAPQVHAVLEMLIDACEGCELHLRHACHAPAAAAAARAAAGAGAGAAR
eukprot:COSAG01_NODE_4826_length_4712_cov_21.963148_7_plen_118_part_01